jgi:hypothetical protein
MALRFLDLIFCQLLGWLGLPAQRSATTIAELLALRTRSWYSADR